MLFEFLFKKKLIEINQFKQINNILYYTKRSDNYFSLLFIVIICRFLILFLNYKSIYFLQRNSGKKENFLPFQIYQELKGENGKNKKNWE